MANTILIKSKTDGAGAPAHGAGLKVAELAVNTSNTPATAAGRGNLFLGVTAESATNLTAGTNTASAYAADQTGGIVWVGAPILDEDNMASDDATKLATQQSIKAYVDTATAANRDIDALGALSDVGNIHQTNDHFLISDAGTEKKITFSDLEDEIFGNVSSDITIAAGGAATIGATKVTGAMLNDDAISGQDAIGGAPANSDELLLSDGGVLKSITISNLAASGEFASGTPTAITVADESSDATCFPLFVTAATGDLGPKSGSNLTFASNTGVLTATGFAGALTGDVTGDVTGDTSGSAGTVTSIGNLTGDVTSSNRATTIAAAAVHHGMLNDDIISGQDDLGANIASTDEFLISDASDSGIVKRMDASRLTTFLQSALTFTTNTDADVSVANLKTRLAGGFGSNAVTIGDSSDVVTIGNDLIVTGDLTVSGDTTTLNVATLDVEDKNITLNKGSGDTSGSANGAGITIQDAVDASNDATILWTASSDTFTFSHAINANVTGNVTGNASGSSGSCTGNAATATALATARAINGTNFDGSGDITITAAGSTLSDTVTVAKGGTGATSLTDGGILVGSGTGAVTALAVLGDGEMLVGDGTTDPSIESGATLRTSIGVGTGDSPQFTGIELGHATQNTLSASSGIMSIEGVAIPTISSTHTLTNKTLTSPDINTPDIDGGTIDGATIATSDVTVGSGKTLNVSGGTLTTSAAQNKAIVQGIGSNFDVGNVTMTANGLTIDGTFTDGTMSIVGGAISSATIDAGNYTAA